MKKFFEENKFYFICIMLVFGINAVIYFLIKSFISDFHLIGSSLDDKIPFIPIFIIPYSIWYPFIIISYFFVFKNSKDKFKRLISVTIFALLIAYACFIIYPTMVNRPIVDSYNSLSSLLLYLTYKLDVPVNCFPSCHCLLSFITMYFVTFDKDMNKYFRVTVGIISILIVLSTLFVKQHVIIDVLGAFVISTILFINNHKINIFK